MSPILDGEALEVEVLDATSPSPAQQELARRSLPGARELALAITRGHSDVFSVKVGRRRLDLPSNLMTIVYQALSAFAHGDAVAVYGPRHAEVTTQQAAGLLGVSRPTLIRLLDAGEIEYRWIGAHRRVRVDSLEEYLGRSARPATGTNARGSRRDAIQQMMEREAGYPHDR
jgi:excisionase family DNA binding protein